MSLHFLLAQCVMCYRTAAAQQLERSRVLNSGIAILLVPPILVLAGILFLAFRKSARQSIRTGYVHKVEDGFSGAIQSELSTGHRD